MKAYYDRRAPEYDDWWLGTGLFADRDRPGWSEEVDALIWTLAALSPARTLDIACGTGFLTRHLPGDVVGLDQSSAMLEIARERAPDARFVQGEGIALPFADDSFDRVVTAHFYGHLEDSDRSSFLSEARRVARELVVVDAMLRDDVSPEERQERILNDGSRWQVYKRYFTPEVLTDELGSGQTVFAGRWFVVVASPRP